ncbi:unnamed protein product [Pleuronectes platessa]|uniref:DUF6729 domain-containing protein n=1 Tax=Pleuronectes platessa TaxID=8262 RepID=A0A9N7UYE5_PLEPL|nr:unnamed protein product [Pleuronectes platessa]
MRLSTQLLAKGWRQTLPEEQHEWLSCDKRVLGMMKARGGALGNSASRLRAALLEQHTIDWLLRILRYLSGLDQLQMPGVAPQQSDVACLVVEAPKFSTSIFPMYFWLSLLTPLSLRRHFICGRPFRAYDVLALRLRWDTVLHARYSVPTKYQLSTSNTRRTVLYSPAPVSFFFSQFGDVSL